MEDRTPLTEDEVDIAAQAFALDLEGKRFRPDPGHLPDCERLRERGWLTRTMEGDRAYYELSETGRVAMELNGLTGDVSMN